MSQLNLIFLFVLSTISCFIEAARKTPWNCDLSAKKEVEDLMTKVMIFGQAGLKFPVNKQELKKYCKTELSHIAKVDDYKTQCLKGDEKRVVSLVLYRMKEYLHGICKNPNSLQTKNLLSSTPCANAASDGYYQCQTRLFERWLAVEHEQDNKKKHAQICCAYQDNFNCMEQKSKKFKQCSDDALEHNVDYIKGMFGNTIRSFCAEYDESSDKCSHVKFVAGKNAKNSVTFYNGLVRTFAFH